MSPRFFFTTLFSALGAAGIVIFGSDAIEANVEPTISTEAKPMPVTVERLCARRQLLGIHAFPWNRRSCI